MTFSLPGKLKRILSYTLVIAVIFLFNTHLIKAASVYINPATGSIDTQNFTLTATVDPENDSIMSASVYISYEPSKVEVSSITQGEFDIYTTEFDDQTEGIIHIVAENTTAASGQIIDLTSINFNDLSSTGTTASFSILNTPTYTSEVLNEAGVNILTSTSEATLTLNSGASNDTMTTESTTSMEVPETGYDFLDYRFLIFLSMSLSLVSFIIRKNAQSKY